MHRLRVAYDSLLRTSGAAPGFIVALIAIGITADVLARNAGLGGIGWMLETVEYALYMLTFTGAAHALAKSRHITIDFFADSLSPTGRRALAIFASSIVLVVCLFLTGYSAATTWGAYADNSLVFKSFTIPEWVPLAYLLPTMLLLTIEALFRWLAAIRGRAVDTAGSSMGRIG